MNPFKLPPPQRLHAWSTFRDSLPALAESTQIQEVAEYWQQCPFERWTIDPENPREWITVWEMLYEGQYCMNAVAVGIESTLRNSGWDPARLELVMIREKDTLGSDFFVVKIDNQVVLNYSYGKCVPVTDLEPNIEFMYAYRWMGNAYKKI